MKAAFYTLGCKVNQNETAALEEIFRRGGFAIVHGGERADVYIVNSCTVTAEGEAKSRRWLRRAKRQNPEAITVLCGCFPQAFPERAAAYDVDVIAGTARRAQLLGQVRAFLDKREKVVDIAPLPRMFELLPAGQEAERTRGVLKIQDGCNRRCAYCAIPAARGPARSRPEEDILREARAKAGRGCRELVLTGINLPSYGRDTGTDLAGIVESLSGIAGVERIRLSSLEPDLLDEGQIRRFAAAPKLCPHFHLSLQSGCDATLRRMRRPYSAAQYAEVAAAIRSALPGASLTTDLIVGFPGESEAEFAESLAFMEEMRFLKVHVFPYSRRPGTPAADYAGQLPKSVKEQRSRAMRDAAERVRAAWIAGQEGARHAVLLERRDELGYFTGYTGSYIPMAVDAPEHARGDIVEVVLESYDGRRCLGRLADGERRVADGE